jgi:hypothetical protein
LILSTAVFAKEDHSSEALEHANAAVEHGKAGHAPVLVDHAKLALEHTLAGSLVAKGVAKNHLDAAAKSLQDAIDQGDLDQTAAATKAAEQAVGHIKASGGK